MTLEKYQPKKLIIFSRDEMKQWDMAKEFADDQRVRFFIGDVRDRERLYRALDGVDYVVHAAATKIVPTAEYNPFECVKTNIDGAMNLIDACIDKKVKGVVALSTDKASSPINLYGATKLASDKLFISGNNFGGGITQFAVVRYGNVVGSRGSVVPFFSELIKKKQKYLPITHTSMTRFWIGIEQGINLVEKSFSRMIGGEIFIPIIPSIKITDLAKAMAPKLKQKIIGIRPGEKIHETMCSIDDAPYVLKFKDYYLITPSSQFYKTKKDYKKNKLNELGKEVNLNFEYNSGTNKNFLTISEIRKMNLSNEIDDFSRNS